MYTKICQSHGAYRNQPRAQTHRAPEEVGPSHPAVVPRPGMKIGEKNGDMGFPKNILPETNIAPENQWLEDEISFLGYPVFSGELLVWGRVLHNPWLD